MNDIVVIKLDSNRREVWRYSGRVLKRAPGIVLLEGLFNRDDGEFYGMRFKRNDRFVEAYFSTRWYNIFEIYDRDDGQLKGWYCNVTRPAEFGDGEIHYVDLALDLLVFPDGRQLVLDEDEFAVLQIDASEREAALAALAELQGLFKPGWNLEQGWLEDNKSIIQ